MARTGQIELLTWAWGVDSTGPIGGGGGGAGKATPRDLVVVARSGLQSPRLLLDANSGRHVATAVLTCVRKPKKPFTFMTLKLQDVLVTSYAVTPDPTDGVPLDLVHLEFAKLEFTAIPQNADGSAGSPVTTTFDYVANTGA